jgi:hypothetical protein
MRLETTDPMMMRVLLCDRVKPEEGLVPLGCEETEASFDVDVGDTERSAIASTSLLVPKFLFKLLTAITL